MSTPSLLRARLACAAALFCCAMTTGGCGGSDTYVPAAADVQEDASMPAAPPGSPVTYCNLPRPSGVPAWSTPRRVSPDYYDVSDAPQPEAYPQLRNKQIAFAPDCSGFITFTASQNEVFGDGTTDTPASGNGLLSLRYDPAGRTWRDEYVIFFRGSPQWLSRLKIAPNGQAFVAVRESEGGLGGFSRYGGGTALRPWSGLNVTGDLALRQVLDFRFDGKDVVVAGEAAEIASPLNAFVTLRRIDAVSFVGGPVGSTGLPSGTTVDLAQLGVDVDDRHFLVWRERQRDGSGLPVGSAGWRRNWTSVGGTAFEHSQGEALPASAGSVALATGAARAGAAIAWRDGATPAYPVGITRFCPRTGCWQQPATLGYASDDGPVRTLAADDEYRTVWARHDASGDRSALWINRLRDGQPAEAGSSAQSPALSGRVQELVVRGLDGGRTVAVAASTAGVFSLRFDGATSSWSLSADSLSGPAPAGAVRVETLDAVDAPSGDLIVFWRQDRGGTVQWWLRRFSARTGQWDALRRIDPLQGLTARPELAVSPDGTVWVLYERAAVAGGSAVKPRLFLSYLVPAGS